MLPTRITDVPPKNFTATDLSNVPDLMIVIILVASLASGIKQSLTLVWSGPAGEGACVWRAGPGAGTRAVCARHSNVAGAVLHASQQGQ